MPLRLNKFLSGSGVASRREADRLIAAGRVAVNGEAVTDLGVKIDEARDRVAVDGKTVVPAREHLYVMLHKPSGCIVTRADPEGRPTVMDLLPPFRPAAYPVGRLDFNSEGLLLLTNDGELAYRLTHPKSEINKEYAIRVQGEVTEAEVARLERGVFVDGRKTAPARIRIFERSSRRTTLLVEIHEGRKREVRRMLETVGHPVLGLKRVEFAGLRLAPLPRGRWRFLRAEEVLFLKRQTGLAPPRKGRDRIKRA